ncbi:hypothetical protein FRZ54_18505 [Mucilaginibacter ginsenosidivorans]|uniref:Uncharacterized protein n=2 Tax=Mucilaginibacter ginsenosidivorans TaxID=398053 RepID=A0A5B8UZ97_9SPHI|nr:hypothetical protein FRZ54_18505 [Mucilaginibacter ginsenosidivorans]
MLIINESFVFVRKYNLKFLWSDIDEMVNDGTMLHIVLYDPLVYLDRMPNLFSQIYGKLYFTVTQNTPFKIRLDLIDIHKNALLETLNNYSIASEQKT